MQKATAASVECKVDSVDRGFRQLRNDGVRNGSGSSGLVDLWGEARAWGRAEDGAMGSGCLHACRVSHIGRLADVMSGKATASYVTFSQGRRFRRGEGRSDIFEVYLACSRREDIAWSGGNAVWVSFFAFFTEGSFPTEPVTCEAHPYSFQVRESRRLLILRLVLSRTVAEQGSEMTNRRDWEGGGDESEEESTQWMIERIWESLTDIRTRLDQQAPVQSAAAVPLATEEAVPVAPVPPSGVGPSVMGEETRWREVQYAMNNLAQSLDSCSHFLLPLTAGAVPVGAAGAALAVAVLATLRGRLAVELLLPLLPSEVL
ncbi:hypothetical protein Taro_044752 [Colocasia esculenta]|uniref:Uncharacterized protein n=1 Tax=Colocasia esculenta TaxID=4460 RepID=A0A843X1F8_COLES|nr:hypothetical protein [Colocasia esculenta]